MQLYIPPSYYILVKTTLLSVILSLYIQWKCVYMVKLLHIDYDILVYLIYDRCYGKYQYSFSQEHLSILRMLVVQSEKSWPYLSETYLFISYITFIYLPVGFSEFLEGMTSFCDRCQPSRCPKQWPHHKMLYICQNRFFE